MGDAVKSKEGIITLQEALALEGHEVEEYFKEYINPQMLNLLKLLGLNKQFKRAKGTTVWDELDQPYIDFLGAYGALNIGHNHEKMLEKMASITSNPNLLQTSINRMASVLARNLAIITPGSLQYSFFCNSGAEAVEGALKLAKIASGKSRVIYCKGSFHGKSMGALTVTGRNKYKKHFGPLVPFAEEVTFGDIDQLKEILESYDDIAAFILEPIQGEGGIIVPPTGYLRKAKELCQLNNVLLIIDEVQTGFGRTGNWFACEGEAVEPDILCMAKSLGGGIMPIGAYIATEAVWKKGYGTLDRCLLHTSTFGGNTWACAAGIAAIEIIDEENLLQEAAEKGEYFLKSLKSLQEQYTLLKDVRGKGLLIGIEFNEPGNSFIKKHIHQQEMITEFLGGMIASELFNNYHIITAYTLNNPQVIRIEPPLNISYEEIDYFINSLESILQKKRSLTGITFQSIKNLVSSGKAKREAK